MVYVPEYTPICTPEKRKPPPRPPSRIYDRSSLKTDAIFFRVPGGRWGGYLLISIIIYSEVDTIHFVKYNIFYSQEKQ